MFCVWCEWKCVLLLIAYHTTHRAKDTHHRARVLSNAFQRTHTRSSARPQAHTHAYDAHMQISGLDLLRAVCPETEVHYTHIHKNSAPAPKNPNVARFPSSTETVPAKTHVRHTVPA